MNSIKWNCPRLAFGAVLVLMMAFGCAAFAAAPKSDNGGKLLPAGYLSTRGSQIIDSHGNPVRIDSVGWNGTNYVGLSISCLDSANYKDMMDGMVTDGFNCIRFSWTDAGLRSKLTVLNSIDYTKNPDMVGLTQMRMLDRIIAYAGTIGLKVILDHHVDEGLVPSDQQKNGLWFDVGPGTDGTNGAGQTGTVTAETFQNDWASVAKRYAGNSTVIGCDLDNETFRTDANGLNWGLGGPCDIWNMFTDTGNAIQAVNPGVLIICQGPMDDFSKDSLLWGRMDLSHVADKPVVLNIPHKVVYSVHEYPKEVADRAPDNGPDFVKELNADWGYLVTENIAPIWIGEMGAGLGPDDTDGRAWAATILPYIDGLYGYLGGPTFKGNEQAVSTDWWAWDLKSSDLRDSATLRSYYPLTFDPTIKAVTDQLIYK